MPDDSSSDNNSDDLPTSMNHDMDDDESYPPGVVGHGALVGDDYVNQTTNSPDNAAANVSTGNQAILDYIKSNPNDPDLALFNEAIANGRPYEELAALFPQFTNNGY